ncbi:MAG: pseudouridine synthase [Eubacteriales bacterium]|nr:pseudouridine synthase [Eubacteriales bacterium]
MRLDKYLAECGIGTRTEVKKIIAGGRIGVNGTPVKDAGLRIDEKNDIITLDSRPLNYSEFEYWMLNKPAGIVSASRKYSLKRGETIPDGEEIFAVDLIKESAHTDLFPAGRLDKDTEGFLLITNDGDLSHRLLSPKKHVPKTYYTELDGELSDEDIKKIEQGIDIGDEKPTLPCKIESLTPTSCTITITEGRYHQVKRMFEAVGLTVTYLKRISFGPIALDETLMPGEYRSLTKEELEKLL